MARDRARARGRPRAAGAGRRAAPATRRAQIPGVIPSVPRAALAHVPPPPPSPRVLRAEARVRALLDELLALDAEVGALRAELAAFDAAWRATVGAALGEVEDAERLARRLRRLEDEVAKLSRAGRAARGERRAAAAPPPPGRPPPAAAGSRGEPALEAEEVSVKRLHRHLARTLHPDLAPDDGERARRSTWMALANDAYHRRDLAALEVLAGRIRAGEPAAPTSEPERLAWLGRRERALAAAGDALGAERARLRRGDAFWWRAQAARRSEEGGDLAAETRADALARAAAAREAALARWDSIARSAAALPAAAARRALRSGVARAAHAGASRRPSPSAREAARGLAELAGGPQPWRAALPVAALLGELGEAVPEGLSTATALAARWDALREAWPGAPALAYALAASREVEPALRARGDAVELAPRLAPDLAAALRESLAAGPLAGLGRTVLAALGPEERCPACRRGTFARHLLRLRGPDEVHALACGRCGATLRGYWRYGGPRGVEGLWPIALELGMAHAVEVRFGRATLAFGLLPRERARLTAAGLCRLAHALCFAPHGVPLPAEALAVQAGGRTLGARTRVPEGAPLALVAEGSATTASRALALVRAAVARRFR
jgi:hypothetical protein